MQTWYQFKNKAKQDSAEISIYGEIGESWDDESVTAKNFIKELKTLNAKNIDLHINSPGGSVFDGLAIYNALKAHSANITVYIDGLAASIASVIAMAGDTIKQPENAMMMIHDPTGLVAGTSEDMAKMAEALNKMKIGLISAYRDKTGLGDTEISDIMSAETWLTSQDAVDLGFADEVLEASTIQANIAGLNNFGFRNIPGKFSNKSTEQLDHELWNSDENLRQEFGGNLVSFLAYSKGERDGRIHRSVLKRNTPKTAMKRDNQPEKLSKDQIENEAKSSWESDPNLRQEFRNDFKIYLAYFTGVAQGIVRTLKKRQKGGF